jgi:hypothetical protein
VLECCPLRIEAQVLVGVEGLIRVVVTLQIELPLEVQMPLLINLHTAKSYNSPSEIFAASRSSECS